MTTVLVCGATGNTGSEVLRQLRGEDVTLRALTRSKESAERLSAEGVQAFVGNLEEVAGLGPALDGVDVVYVANPASPELPALEGALAAAARDAGVGHLVKLSVIGAAADSPLSFAELHFHAEELIRQSGIGWTMLRPNGFMQNTLAWSAQIPGGVIYGPVMDARWSIIDVRDIGAVGAAAILDAAGHAGKTYELTGPEDSSPREQVAIVAELLGVPLEAQEVTIDQAKATMLSMGWPEWNVERMGELFEIYAEGIAQTISGDVEVVTGRPARTYGEFAADHLDTFRAGGQADE
jgi:uncharacterized protein YbjT (DUF2867 family)